MNPDGKNKTVMVDGESGNQPLTKEERLARKKARMERMAAQKEERLAKRKARIAAKRERIAERRAARKSTQKEKKTEGGTAHKEMPVEITSNGDPPVVLEDVDCTNKKAKEIAAKIYKEEQCLVAEAKRKARQKFMKDVEGKPALRKEVLQELRRTRQKESGKMQCQGKNKRRKDVGGLEDNVSSLKLQ